MRRAAVVLVLGLVASSCAAAFVAPAQPIAQEQLDGGLGLDVAAARSTVLAFLDAYANSGTDGVAPLRSLVAGPDLRSWVRWLGVQNAQFGGTIAGTVDLRSASFVDSIPLKNAIGSQVDLGASVTFTFTPTQGQAFRRTRILDGPVTLVRFGLADWRIVDITRDGMSMDAGITRFDVQPRRAAGVSVRLDSVFRFVPSWQFNVVVTNGTNRPIGLDPTTTALVVRSPGGSQGVTTIPSPSLADIAPGATVDGLLAVPYQTSARGSVLTLRFVNAHGKERAFTFALGGLIPPVPGPSTGAGSPAPSSG